jgi:hypothetical protein
MTAYAKSAHVAMHVARSVGLGPMAASDAGPSTRERL